MLSRVTVPSAVVPSLNVTDPVGTVELAGTVVTVAVKVTEPPAKTGFTSAERVVLVGAGWTVKRYALIEPMTGLLPKPPIIEVASLGVTRTTLSELVNEKRGISPEMAVRLSEVFGGSAESWLTQQAQYELAQVRTDRIKLRRLVLA